MAPYADMKVSDDREFRKQEEGGTLWDLSIVAYTKDVRLGRVQPRSSWDIGFGVKKMTIRAGS